MILTLQMQNYKPMKKKSLNSRIRSSILPKRVNKWWNIPNNSKYQVLHHKMLILIKSLPKTSINFRIAKWSLNKMFMRNNLKKKRMLHKTKWTSRNSKNNKTRILSNKTIKSSIKRSIIKSPIESTNKSSLQNRNNMKMSNSNNWNKYRTK
jgi:hypothetical protein